MTYKDMEVQPDLFGSQKNNSKNGILQKNLFANSYKSSYSVTPDSIVVFVIAGLMVNLIAYAIGIEQGKKLLAEKPAESKPATSVAELSVEQKVESVSVPVVPEQKNVTEKETAAPADTEENEQIKSGYVIQLVTYSSDSHAQKEIEKLQLNGFNGFVLKKGQYYVVYSGTYDQRGAALEKMSDLKKKYKDCFVKAWK